MRRVVSDQWLTLSLGLEKEVMEEMCLLFCGGARGLEKEGRQEIAERRHAADRGRGWLLGGERCKTDGLGTGCGVKKVHDRQVRSLDLERSGFVETEEGREGRRKRYGGRMRNGSTHRLDESEVAPASELGEGRVCGERGRAERANLGLRRAASLIWAAEVSRLTRIAQLTVGKGRNGTARQWRGTRSSQRVAVRVVEENERVRCILGQGDQELRK